MAERVEVFQDTAGDWWWRKYATNENKIGTSGEGYENKLHAIRMAKQENEGVPVYVIDVKEKVPVAPEPVPPPEDAA